MNRTHVSRTSSLVVLALLAGCGGGDSDPAPATAPSYLTAPSVVVAPDPFTPLAAQVTLETDQPTRVQVAVEYADGTPGGTFVSEGFATNPTVDLVMLRPGEAHELVVSVENAGGLVTDWTGGLGLLTDPLPADLPPFEVAATVPAEAEPGYRLFCAVGTEPGTNVTLSHVCLVDVHGELVWYHRSQNRISDLRRLRNGNLLYAYDNLGLREIDLTGQVVNEWWASTWTTQDAPLGATMIPIDTIHHEVFELPEGDDADFLVLSSALHTVRDYPLDVVDQTETETAQVVSDVIYTVRRDGTVLDSWDLLDLLDPRRLCYDSLGAYWNNVYGAGTRDWTHANAAIYDPLHDEIVVSARHQEAVFAFGRSDRQLHWILGDHDQWFVPYADALLEPPTDPTAEFEWPYHQHAPSLTGPDTVLLFDNGNNRAVPPAVAQTGDPYSRAVEYRIDRAARTVEQIWSYGGPADPWYSFAVGDADLLPTTGNVLVTDGARVANGVRWGRVFEVTRDGDVVFELKVQDAAATDAFSWLLYRAEHLPSFP